MNVGEIIYIRVLAQEMSQKILVPVKIVERLIRESMDGIITTYVAQTPGGEQYELNSTEEMFKTLESARVELIEESTRNIDDIIKKASLFEQKYFNSTGVTQNEPQQEDVYVEENTTAP
jgi:adenine specific DNA methylase Mod